MGKDNPADRNRAVRLAAVRELDRLLTKATAPDFTGNVSVEISSKDGRLGVPKVGCTRFGIVD